MLRFAISPDMNLIRLVPGLALYGIGLGLVLSQINNLTLSAVPVREAGEASGVLNTFRQVGISLGAAIIGAILISTILVRLDSAIAQSRDIPQQSKQHIIGMLAAQSSGVAFGDSGMFNAMPPQTRNEMMSLRRAATTAAIQRAFWYGAGFALLGLGVASFLPRRPKRED